MQHFSSTLDEFPATDNELNEFSHAIFIRVIAPLPKKNAKKNKKIKLEETMPQPNKKIDHEKKKEANFFVDNELKIESKDCSEEAIQASAEPKANANSAKKRKRKEINVAPSNSPVTQRKTVQIRTQQLTGRPPLTDSQAMILNPEFSSKLTLPIVLSIGAMTSLTELFVKRGYALRGIR